ncbi:hypothetical protein BOX15_Mlig015060g1 [Macrostomum lignano]|uniref:Nuclear receptor domain-containing protein n=1 Tax=Macrostomum lignano TaxID=282301 RepID=A0A267EFZ2_9PLAT|nr:hypothetical protein BOX15_Mlig015060g1 [Macrostomum lignano]
MYQQQQQQLLEDESCSICFRKATGHHYGAVTCEACKAFFKRTVHSCVTYFCPVQRSGSRCPVPKSSRKRHCPACRWVRCLEARMQTALVRCSSPTAALLPPASAEASAGATLLTDSCSQPAVDSVETAEAAASAASLPLGREPPAYMRQLLAQRPVQGDHQASNRSALVCRLTELLNECTPDDQLHQQADAEQLSAASVSSPAGSLGQSDEHTAQLGAATNKLAVDLIDFSKRLTEFTQLPMEDRVRLLQMHWLSLTVWQVAYSSVPYDGSLKFSASYALREDQASSVAGLIPVRCGSQMRCLARLLTSTGVTWAEFLLLKLVFLFDATSPLDEWRQPEQIQAAQATYLRELRTICPDNARRGKLLSLSGMLSAIQVFSVGYWSRVMQRTTFLPPPLMSEMLKFSLGQVPRISSDLAAMQSAADKAAASECFK